MKVEVSQLNSCRRELRIEVPAQIVEEEIGRAAQRVARSVRLPGFRKGKAPVPIVRTRYAKAIQEEAVEHLMRHSTQDALDKEGLNPLHAPRVSSLDYKPGEPLSFRAVFEVRPAIEPKGYDKLGIKPKPEKITEEQVDERLEAVRQSAARLVPVEDRAAKKGDILLADMRWWRGSRQGKPTERPKVSLELGGEGQHEAFIEALESAEPGQVKEFDVEYPKDFKAQELAGAKILYRVKVHAVRERQVPELNDELARQVGEFADLAALRAEIRKGLEHEAESRGREEAVRRVIEKLLEANPIEVPEVMVEAQIDDQLEEVARALVAQGVPPNKLRVDWNKEREKMRESAQRNVAARLVLDAIADQRKVEVPAEDLDARLEREAQRARLAVAALKARLDKTGGTVALERQIRRERVLDFLLTGVNI